jgi:hypothetical protein
MTDKEPLNSAYDLMGYFPSQTSGIPGLYQSWSAELPCDGEYTISWKGNRTSSLFGTYGSLHRRSYSTPGPVGMVRLATGDLDTATQTVTVTADYMDRLSLGFTELHSVGNAEYYAMFATDYTCDDGTTGTLDATRWTATSGIDANTEDMLSCTTHFFKNGNTRGCR